MPCAGASRLLGRRWPNVTVELADLASYDALLTTGLDAAAMAQKELRP